MMTAQRVLQDDEFAPAHVAERMAAAIVARLEQKGECRIDYLRASGFSLDDIARYWPDACKLAEVKRPRMKL